MGGPIQVFRQSLCQSGYIPLTQQRQNIQMLQCAVSDIISCLKRKKLIALDTGIVVAHDPFEIIIGTAFHDELVQVPVQLRKLLGVWRFSFVAIVQKGLEPVLQCIDFIFRNMVDCSFDGLYLQKTADFLQIFNIFGRQRLYIGADAIFNFQPVFTGQRPECLPNWSAAHTQVLGQLIFTEDVAWGNFTSTESVLYLPVGTLRQAFPGRFGTEHKESLHFCLYAIEFLRWGMHKQVFMHAPFEKITSFEERTVCPCIRAGHRNRGRTDI